MQELFQYSFMDTNVCMKTTAKDFTAINTYIHRHELIFSCVHILQHIVFIIKYILHTNKI